MTGPVPYETLVRWGVVWQRLEVLTEELARCADQAGALVGRLSGRCDADGRWISARPGADPLEGLLGDAFWDQLDRDVARRLTDARG